MYVEIYSHDAFKGTTIRPSDGMFQTATIKSNDKLFTGTTIRASEFSKVTVSNIRKIVIDSTLSVAGAVADAKAVGDAIAESASETSLSFNDTGNGNIVITKGDS